MEKFRAGLSQKDWMNRVEGIRFFSPLVLDKSYQEELIDQFHRLQKIDSESDVQFDVDHLKYTLFKEAEDNGELAPPLALFKIFKENLQDVYSGFNKKWYNLPKWYLNDALKVQNIKQTGSTIWGQIHKHSSNDVLIPYKTVFTCQNKEGEDIQFLTREESLITDARISEKYVIQSIFNPYKYPENELKIPTAVQCDKIGASEDLLQPFGLRITTPTLLLREGKRSVRIILHSRQDVLTDQLHQNEVESESLVAQEYIKTLDNPFLLKISTTEGWSSIDKVKVKLDGSKRVVLEFLLHEEFPSTCPCEMDTHQFSSTSPVLEILINEEASIAPYSWASKLAISEVKVDTDVRGVKNLKVYNELGALDIANTYAPFGSNIRLDSWFAFGSYELGIKPVTNIELEITWTGLPNSDRFGLSSYYDSYDLLDRTNKIDNKSFKASFSYLEDFEWRKIQGGEDRYLFNTDKGDETPDAEGKLVNSTIFRLLPLPKMKLVGLAESDFQFNNQCRNGFLRLQLTSPEMGFGEQEYNKIFNYKTLHKKGRKHKGILNPPLQPLVNSIKINYQATETLRVGVVSDRGAIDTIVPFEKTTGFRPNTQEVIRFFDDYDDYSILLSLSDIKEGQFLNLYFDLDDTPNGLSDFHFSRFRWYIGNSKCWQLMDYYSFVDKDQTEGLSVSGRIRLKFPTFLPSHLFDTEGHLWIKIAIEQKEDKAEKVFSSWIKNVFANAVPLVQQNLDYTINQTDLLETVLEADSTILGLDHLQPIGRMQLGRNAESNRDKVIRFADYVTHRGKISSLRDIERIVLKEFTEIGKVYAYRRIEEGKVNIEVCVVPKVELSQPFVRRSTLIEVRNLLNTIISPQAGVIEVIHPNYEKIQVHAFAKTEDELNLPALKEDDYYHLRETVNNLIAPWEATHSDVQFNHEISLNELYKLIKETFEQSGILLKKCIVYQTCELTKQSKVFHLNEQLVNVQSFTIHPFRKNGVSTPANEQLLCLNDDNVQDGINQLVISQSFKII